MHSSSSASVLITAAAFLSAVANAGGQVVPAPPEPQIGSSNTVTADPPVPRPPTKPCVVPLYADVAFDDFNPRPFSFAPPAGCPGPWSRVVFTADFTVQPGRQFDRTANVYLGNVNLFYGTTAEPRKTLSPSWHVERDVTDLSAIFQAAQSGQANLGNFVGTSGGVTYNSIIFGSAALEFYPPLPFAPAPRNPDVVVGLPDSPGPITINSTTPQLTQAISLPRNIERLYLDVIAQSQNQEEQWFLCVPNDVAGELQSCGNTGFREVEISIDGQPAGVAPVYPWIYTGGIDPYLWEPIPGVQTLNFKPYRVDLTPFAGLVADGNPHNFTIAVFNAYQYFLLDATLLGFADHGSQQVSGTVRRNTLTASPSPAVTENLSTAPDGTISGTVTVTSNRSFVITGDLQTSHGHIATTVQQNVNFSNSQYFLINNSQYTQNLTQANTVESKITSNDGFVTVERQAHISYPFTFELTQNVAADGTITEPNKSDQQYLVHQRESINGIPIYSRDESNEVTSQDTDTISLVNGGYSITAHTGQSSQRYSVKDSLGYCWDRTLQSVNSVLTGYSDGKACTRR